MTIIQKLHARSIIARIAKQQGTSTDQCRSDMAASITEAWVTSDPETKQRQIQLVGDSHIPSPEELILLISQKLLDK
jgi:hypothetical protein